MSKRVYVSEGGVATVSDVMHLITRLPYLDLLAFAGSVQGDADKIADAAQQFVAEEPEQDDD